MRIYLKRILLLILCVISTMCLFLLQTVYYIPLDNNDKNSFNMKMKTTKSVSNSKRLSKLSNEINSDKKIARTSTKTLETSTDNEKIDEIRSNYRKPLSHDELRWPYDYETVNADSSSSINYDKLLSDYLAERKSKLDNVQFAYLQRIPPVLDTSLEECRNWTVLGGFWKKRYKKTWSRSNSWDKFYYQIGTCDLYRENSKIVRDLLDDIANMPIKNVNNMESGTQIKFIITYKNGKKAVFKPMRFGRNYETHPDHFYFTDFERHNAEIAAYHLDRILGFRRAIPTVGRVVNISSELWSHADKVLEKTFFHSPANNLCFAGKCDYYCDTTHAICGNPDTVEGSFQVFLPDRKLVTRKTIRSPFKRTYSKKNQLAPWQLDDKYCQNVVKFNPAFSNGKRLLDLVDLHILDFLMGNQDRHHFETFTFFEENSYSLHLDNGRAFGKSNFDDMDILSPLTQCCVIRPSTLRRLLRFYFGNLTLSKTLQNSMSDDPLAPILADKHYLAMERRLERILKSVHKCISDNGHGDYRRVVMTEFYNADAPNSDLTAEEDDEDDPDDAKYEMKFH